MYLNVASSGLAVYIGRAEHAVLFVAFDSLVLELIASTEPTLGLLSSSLGQASKPTFSVNYNCLEE